MALKKSLQDSNLAFKKALLDGNVALTYRYQMGSPNSCPVMIFESQIAHSVMIFRSQILVW